MTVKLDCPCDECEETDTWECAACNTYAEYIGDEDFNLFDI